MRTNILLIFALIFSISANDGIADYQKVINNNQDIYYRIIGDGTPLLIIGGGPGDNSDRYLSLCELLSNEFKCILIDQRGSGKSVLTKYDSTTVSVDLTLEDFEVLRKKLKLENWSVLGFSYGGYLASLYAQSYPSSISNLILLESAGLNIGLFDYFLDNIESRLIASDLEVLEYWSDSTRMAEDYHHAIVEQIRAKMPGYFFDRKKSLIVSQSMKDSDFNFELGHWIWGDIISKDLDLLKVKPKYKGPVLILHGRQDPVGESVPQLLSKYYNNSKLVFIERSGHYSWVEQPEKVHSTIIDFIK